MQIKGENTMLGQYLLQELQTHPEATDDTLVICDGITKEDLPSLSNYKNIVYISSHEVYSPEAGENVDETRPTFAWSETGKRHARAELLLEKHCAQNSQTLTIVRPAIMFGNGVDGPMLHLFNRVVRGHYVHVRGNNAKVSLVTALDTAKAIIAIAGTPGIFNISDGQAHRWIDIVEAMTANIGTQKRMTHLPEKWIRFIYRWFGRLPIVEECMSPQALEPLGRTCVLTNKKIKEATGLTFHNTKEVIARTDKTYPYQN